MSERLAPGPYRHIRVDEGADVPYYIIPFDKKGRCEGPLTRQHLVDHAKDHTDIFLFSHGWNNDWKTATTRYESFVQGFMQMRRDNKLPIPAGYKPLLVGIFWPGVVLVDADERGPQFAAADPLQVDETVSNYRQAVREIADELPPESIDRFYELTRQDGLADGEALELATLLAPVYETTNDEASGIASRTAAEIVESWKALTPPAEAPPGMDDFGTTGASSTSPVSAAGVFGKIADLARNAIRGATVWQMKDRAGTVGSNGVAPLLTDLLNASDARVHLIGHSYGGKVVLSALCYPATLPRKVHAVLLLQPAVSHLCFAGAVPLANKPGGFHAALDRTRGAILSTFSKHDFPLTQVFHLALVRPSDLGEMRIAAAGEPPSIFAALGGFGPRRCGEQLLDIPAPGDPYPAVNHRIVGLCADRTISGHGDISNPSTWWALHNLVKP